jgi:hypothetical protein
MLGTGSVTARSHEGGTPIFPQHGQQTPAAMHEVLEADDEYQKHQAGALEDLAEAFITRTDLNLKRQVNVLSKGKVVDIIALGSHTREPRAHHCALHSLQNAGR